MKVACMFALLWLGAVEVCVAADFSFSMPVRLTLSRNTASSVAIGDANGDGRKDLALSSALASGDQQLSLFLQRDDGSLAAPVHLSLGQDLYEVYPVAFVDFDGDNSDEMVVGLVQSGMTIVRLDADGTLSRRDYAARRGCMFLTTGDIDADGDTDIACHDTKATVTLYYSDGMGGIAHQAEVATSGGLYSDAFKDIQLADVTGDGRLDLLFTSAIVNSFFVYANNGFGGFWPATVYTHPWSSVWVWPTAIEALDIDGDGVNEVVTASPENQPNSALNIYRRGANGYLVLSQRIALYDSPTALLSGDVDGDGDVELLAGHFAFNALTLLGNDAIGVANQERYELPGFGSSIEFNREVGASNAIALGDLNGDGCIDVAGATYSGIMALYGCEPSVSMLPVSDFDGDGVSDLLWRYEGTGENYLWRWADARSWHQCANLPCSPPMGFEWSAQAVGDFDGDGNSDVFWRNRASGANEIRMSSVYRRSIAGVASQAWQVLGAGDFDGDDRSDLFWRHSKTGANYIWKSADASTKQAVPGVTDQRWEVVGIGDFDGDGQSDLFWRHAGSGRNVVWWEGSGARRTEMIRVGNLAWKVAGVGDFNNDGRDDLAWRNASSGANTIWLAANGSTQRAVRGVTNLAWRIAAVGDYNGDGYSDLMWRNGATGANVIWRSADARQQQAVESRGTGFEPIR